MTASNPDPHVAANDGRRHRVSAVTALMVGVGTLTFGALVGIAAPAHADDVPTAPGEPAGLPESGATTTVATTVPPVTTATTAPTTTAPTTTPTTTKPTATTSPASTAPATVSPPPDPTPATTEPIAAPPEPAAQNVIVYPNQIAHILATIRYLESRDNYTIPPNKGRASGAYQFIPSTWNNYGGYPHAYLAPPEVQDERAAADVMRFLAMWNNDVSMIPVMWYYPRAARDLALMDIVPVPSAGNVLTVREYQQRWLAVWAFLSGQPIPQMLDLAQSLARLGTPPVLPEAAPVDFDLPADERRATIAFPVVGPSRLAAPDCGGPVDAAQNVTEAIGGHVATTSELQAAGLCSEQAPGIVFGVKMQPVVSVADGVVTAVEDVPGEPIAVTVTDVSGRSYRLAGFNDDNPGTDDGAAPAHLRLTSLARVGATVRAGQVLGFMGDTDPLPLGVRSDVPTDKTVVIPIDAVAPHIRLTIRDLDGTPVDAYGPVIDALFTQVCSVAIGPWSSPPSGAGYDTVTTETTDDRPDIDSEWVVTSTGQVTAAGWAAMIYPSESCGWAPPEARGPGAGGAPDVPLSWLVPIDLPTSIWVDLAVRDRDLLTIPLRRP